MPGHLQASSGSFTRSSKLMSRTALLSPQTSKCAQSSNARSKTFSAALFGCVPQKGEVSLSSDVSSRTSRSVTRSCWATSVATSPSSPSSNVSRRGATSLLWRPRQVCSHATSALRSLICAAISSLTSSAVRLHLSTPKWCFLAVSGLASSSADPSLSASGVTSSMSSIQLEIFGHILWFQPATTMSLISQTKNETMFIQTTAALARVFSVDSSAMFRSTPTTP
mmetsp:Transcript_59920/g.178313  ORF Transcript_59920/g.178313 Transcript_59920/m.178313 type:complete len:224 (+) Transcript_59920:47-718(+)